MAPEYGATCAIFPIDAETLRYLLFTGRPQEQVDLVEALRQGAGPLARRELRGPDVLRHARARPRRRRALASPARSARRTACRCASRTRSSARRSTTTSARRSRSPRRRTLRTRSRRATRPATAPGNGGDGHPEPHASTEHVALAERASHASTSRSTTARDRARPRPRRHRRHHELHEHVEPERHARRRAARAERGREGPEVQAVGEDVARARLEGRHRVLRARGPHRAARGARLQPRRLRLHDLHRQQRPAARRRSPRRSSEDDLVVVVRAQRQPQLRGPHQPRREA